MKHAAIGPISIHLPERVETNENLSAEFPDWNLDLIYAKTGIYSRHIAASDEMRFGPGRRRRRKTLQAARGRPRKHRLPAVLHPDARLSLADHRLPVAASPGPAHDGRRHGLQPRLFGLRVWTGAGRRADPLGAASRVLLLTAETYSKYIAASDRSLRTIFGDGAAATLIEASDTPSLSAFAFGTDGAAGDALMVNSGGARLRRTALQPRTNGAGRARCTWMAPASSTLTMEHHPAARPTGARQRS